MSDVPLPPHITLSSLPQPLTPPVPLIKTEEDVERWHRSKGYRDYCLFVQRLNEAVVGHGLPSEGRGSVDSSKAITKTVDMLQTIHEWIDEIPPRPTPQRFGNLAFRDWGKRLEDLAPSLLSSLLPEEFHAAIPLLLPYLLISFGSFTRIDYGSGHELSFATFLLSLTLLRFFDPSSPSEERNLVLVVFKKYLDVVWKLQDVYKLEPAGSHGVWGLDDYHFLTYLWGSAELRNSPTVPSIVLNPNLPTTNLYYLSISRIYSLKTGPFHEHSSLLHSVASSVPNWGKVNSGLWKMYEKEVLSKRVVVQHLPLGGLIGCDEVKPNDDGRSVRAVSVPLGGVRGSAVTASRDGGSRQKGLMGPPPPPTPL